MRYYYEANEIVTEFEEADFVRADITDMTAQEKSDTLQAIKDVMSGKDYSLKEHFCYHDGVPPNTPCEMKEI
jgi:hypothetical protein